MDSSSSAPSSVEEATAAMDISSTEDTTNNTTTNNTTTNNNNTESKDPASDEDSTTDDEILPDNDDDDAKAVSPEQADILLMKATTLKEEGNNEFKQGNLDQASRAYRRSVQALKKLNRLNQGDTQVKALLVTVYTNWSTVSFKQSKFRVSVDVATHALTIDREQVKALFRRAVAQRSLGNLHESRTDLRAALVLDATNVACKKELLAVKQELEQATATQKKALAKAFDSSKGSFLYNDMQDATVKREEKEKRQKALDAEQLQKRKVAWEDECVSRMARNEPALAFDDWDKQRLEREETERKEAAARRKMERKAAKEKENMAIDDKGNDDDDDDDELTQSELALMRGYKKTADGRTTSYFTRELSAEEKGRLGDTAPKRLDSLESTTAGHSTTRSHSHTATAATATTAATGSAWNQAGTWEEKDTTDWCQTRLRQRLLEAQTTTDAVTVHITAVEELTGDAAVAVVSGKKRFIFDFHVKLKYEMRRLNNNDNKGTTPNDDSTTTSHELPVLASGVVRLPDICSTHHDETEVMYDSWTKQPSNNVAEQDALAGRAALTDYLQRVVVALFVQDFNQAY